MVTLHISLTTRNKLIVDKLVEKVIDCKEEEIVIKYSSEYLGSEGFKYFLKLSINESANNIIPFLNGMIAVEVEPEGYKTTYDVEEEGEEDVPFHGVDSI